MNPTNIPWLRFAMFFVAGYLVGLLITCENDISPDKTQTKIEVRYRYITKTDTFRDQIPVVKYRNIRNDSLIYVPSSESSQILPEFKPSDYAYSYNKSFYSVGNKVRNDITIKGWGKLEDIQSAFTIHDTLADTIKTVTTTKYRVPNALYLSGGYYWSPVTQKAIKMTGLDFTFRGKAIIGASVGLDADNQMLVGGKLGIKL